MNEKAYKTMGLTGAAIGGARLLKNREGLMF